MRWYLPVLFLTSMLMIFQFFSIGSFGVVPIEVWMLVLYAWFPVKLLWQGRPLRVPLTVEMGASVAVWGIVLISCLSPLLDADAVKCMQSLKTFGHFTFIWLFFMIIVCLEPDSRDWREGMRWYAGVALIICTYGAYQLAARAFDLPLAWIEVTNVSFKNKMDETTELGQLALQFANFFRATSIFSEPSALASYAAMALTFTLIPIVRKGPGMLHTRWMNITVIMLCIVALVTAFSLTGLMLVSVLLAVLVFMHRDMITRRFLYIMVAVTAVVVVTDVIVAAYFDVSILQLFAMRIESIVSGKAASGEAGSLIGESLTQRTGDYTASYMVWTEAPFLGVGPGNFSNSDFGKNYSAPFPSTLYGSLLAEQGPVGLLLVVYFFVSLLAISWKLLRRWQSRPDLVAKHPDIDAHASVLPFVAALSMFVNFNSNLFVFALYWLQIAIIMTGTTILRRTMGELRTLDLYFVRRPWRDRAHEVWKGAMTTPPTAPPGKDH
jgi:O-antigen ligase